MEIQAKSEKSTAGNQEKVGLRDDGKWGPCDIIKKTFEIYRGQACTFTWIQVTIVFPCTILWLLNQYYGKKLVHEFWPNSPCPSSPCPPPSQCSIFGDDPCEWKGVVAFIVLTLLGFVYWINVVGSLFFAVGSAYAGKTICFKDVIAALPGLWNGLIITGLWSNLFFVIAGVIIVLLGYLLMTLTSVSVFPIPIASLLTVTVGSIILFFVTTTNQMAKGVTVFDQICGLPAFCKALELLKCKWCVALGIAIIFFIPQAILTVIVNAATWSCFGVWAKFVLLGILANLLSVAVHLNVMASVLLYLSAKQSHNQSISVEHFSQNQFESGYQRIGV